MYVALIATGLGGLLLYRTWTFLLFAVTMLGLPLRARREEDALAAEFGQAWEAYRGQVPSWMPRLRR
jgi:protein-S-isoprenylcysteine O-methyltransferase Ste14